MTTGGVAGNEVVLTGGVKPGQTVVTAGVHLLKPGQKVTVLAAGRPAVAGRREPEGARRRNQTASGTAQ